MLKIGFSGAHSTGKTTLIRDVVGKLTQENIRATKVPEVARELIERSCETDFLHRDKVTKERQFWIQLQQLIGEMNYAQLFSDTILLVDRTYVDNLAYLRHNFPPTQRDITMDLFFDEQARLWMDTYDLVFYLPVTFSLELDTVREDDIGFQLRIDEMIRGYLLEYNIPFVTLTGSEGMRARLATDAIMRAANWRRSAA